MKTCTPRLRSPSITAGILILLGTLVLTAGCWRIGAERNVVRNGIEFSAFREQDNGARVGTLAADTIIDGWPCRRGFVAFHSDWRLDELQLSRDYERNGIFMPEGTWVFPDDKGSPGVCMFPHDVEIQGYPCRGSWAGKEGFMTIFYPSGRLKLFFVRDPILVDGVMCADSLFHGIALHESGRLNRCKLAKSVRIGGVEYRKGSIIQLEESGRATGGN